MGKDQQTPKNDILDEKYKGPNGVVSALGYGAIETKLAWVFGLGLGAVGGFVFHQPVAKFVGGIRKSASQWSNSENSLSKTGGNILAWVFGREEDKVIRSLQRAHAGLEDREIMAKEQITKAINHRKGGIIHSLSEELFKIPGVGNLLKKGGAEKMDAAIMGGGLSSIAFIAGSSVAGSAHGYVVAEEGKNQFKRAQEEIRELREDIQFVEDKNSELRKEIRDTNDNTLAVAKDDLPKIEQRPVDIATPVRAPHELDVPKKEIAAETVQHMAAHEYRGEAHKAHVHHSDRHHQHGSHGEAIRHQQEAAAAHSASVA